MGLGSLIQRVLRRPGGTGSVARAPSRPARAAWRDLPPIQRSIGEAPIVAGSPSFAEGLPGHRPAPLALEPLGHEVGLDAPAGIVLGVGRVAKGPVASPMAEAVRSSRHQPGLLAS